MTSQAEKAEQRTVKKKRLFLALFAALGNVSAAAEKAGVGRRTVYDWIAEDTEFKDAFNEARETAADGLELEARRRAVDGSERPVFQGGKQVGTVREYSDRLLEVLLRANRPEKFTERLRSEHSGPDGGPVKIETGERRRIDLTKLTDAQLEEYEGLLEQMIALEDSLPEDAWTDDADGMATTAEHHQL